MMDAMRADLDLKRAPIGMFDSGIGGLSILREVQRQLPNENILYLADQAHVPYGSRSLENVRQLSFAITDFLIEQGVKLVAVACNTASAASLHALRERHPQIPFVGMEPAVKPAAENSQTRTVGVLATPATFQGALFASVVERFADGVTVLQETLPGLVEQVEKGEIDSARTRSILEQGVRPLLDAGADTLVLACTHFPFVIPQLQAIVGEGIRVIDPAPAVARQIGRLLTQRNQRSDAIEAGTVRYMSSGDPGAFKATLLRLGFGRSDVLSAGWVQDRIRLH
jgi:glutamate racemase